MTNKLQFELYNKSELFFKYRAKLDLLRLFYGDDAKVYDIMEKELKK